MSESIFNGSQVSFPNKKTPGDFVFELKLKSTSSAILKQRCLVRTDVWIQWFPVYKVFHRIRFCGNQKLFDSNSNVILTLQTCGQRSSMAAESKRRALALLLFVPWQFCIVFVMSKCSGGSDLGMCMTLGLAKRMRLRSGDFRFKNVFCREIRRICKCIFYNPAALRGYNT